MNKLALFAFLLTIGLISCKATMKVRQATNETEFEMKCHDFTLNDLMLNTICDIDNIPTELSIDLNECFGTQNGLLAYPGSNMMAFCDRCELLDEFRFQCHCYPNMLSSYNATSSEANANLNEGTANTATEGEGKLSYFDLRRIINFNNNTLSC